MATSAYLTGRRRYTRPQGILWANNAGTLSNGLYVPTGVEVGASTTETDPNLLDQFIILSDKIEHSAYQKIGVTGNEQIHELSQC